MALATAGCARMGVLAPAGPVAEALNSHLWSIIGLTLIVIVPLFVALPLTLWRYRHGNTRARYRPDWHFSWPLEALIWGVPILITAVLAWNLWVRTAALDPYDPIDHPGPALRIEVVSLDWKWLFIYPEQNVATVDELVVPADRPLEFHLTSATVMQSFMIPRLGGQIYTMAGMVTRLNLLASEPGRYRGQNTQYNGPGFAKQQFIVRSVTPEAFDAWATEVAADRPPLTDERYAELAKPRLEKEPLAFSAPAPDLFTRVVESFKGPAEQLEKSEGAGQ